MTQFARVSMTDVAKSGRMDPGFHIAAQRVGAEVAALEGAMDAGAAQETAHKLASIMEPQHLRQVLEPIRRGEGDRSLDEKELGRLTKAYPHLALALLLESAPITRDALLAQSNAIQVKQDTLGEIYGKMEVIPRKVSGPKPR